MHAKEQIQKRPVISLFFITAEKQSEIPDHQVIALIQVHKTTLSFVVYQLNLLRMW